MSDDGLITSDQHFTSEERVAIGRVARLIIGPDPEHDLPAADDAEVLANILVRAMGFERQVRGGVASLQALAQEQYDVEPGNLHDEALEYLIDNHGELRSFYRSMMQIVAQAYYQDPRVLASLGMEPRPPFPKGHEVEEGDWTLLDVVRQRAPFYRDV